MHKIKYHQEHWDKAWEIGGGRLPALATYINANLVRRNKSVLEVGCGDMRHWVPYSHRDKYFVGLDISKVALAKAEKNFKEGHFIYGNAIDLPFSDKSFQIVTSFDTVSALGSNAFCALSEMIRVAGEEVIFTVAHEGQHKQELTNGYGYLQRKGKIYGKLIKFKGIVDSKEIDNIIFTHDSLINMINDLPSRFNFKKVSVRVFNDAKLNEVHGVPIRAENANSYLLAIIRKS